WRGVPRPSAQRRALARTHHGRGRRAAQGGRHHHERCARTHGGRCGRRRGGSAHLGPRLRTRRIRSMSMADLAKPAARLDEAARSARSTAQLSKEVELSLDQAYEIQKRSVARRLKRGETRVGVKMGLTSRAKALQMG